MVKKEVWISFPKKVLKSYEFHSSSFLARVNYDLNPNILHRMRSPVDREGYDGVFFFFSTDVMLIQSNPPWTQPQYGQKIPILFFPP